MRITRIPQLNRQEAEIATLQRKVCALQARVDEDKRRLDEFDLDWRIVAGHVQELAALLDVLERKARSRIIELEFQCHEGGWF